MKTLKKDLLTVNIYETRAEMGEKATVVATGGLAQDKLDKALEIIKASTEYGVTIRGLYKETDENEFEEITY